MLLDLLPFSLFSSTVHAHAQLTPCKFKYLAHTIVNLTVILIQLTFATKKKRIRIRIFSYRSKGILLIPMRSKLRGREILIKKKRYRYRIRKR